VKSKVVFFRFGDRDKSALICLADAWGVSQGDVVRLLLRDAARRIETGGRPPVLETPATPGQTANGGTENGNLQNV